jgi:hypothetical protein
MRWTLITEAGAKRVLASVAVGLISLTPVDAASLKLDTVEAWDRYIDAVNVRTRDRGKPGRAFLWMDEAPDRAAKVRQGKAVVSKVEAPTPAVPSGLIHDWIGVTFIANTTMDKVLPVVRDYGRYKDYYRPAVIDSKPIALGDTEDRFSMVLSNKALFHSIALESDYKSTRVELDRCRSYTIAQTTRTQEIVDYGAAGQHALPDGEGTGLIWRLFAVTRFEERDGGVYVEVEAIALSRDIPATLRWLVDPIVQRVAKASLTESLEQTRTAVLSNSARQNVQWRQQNP